MWNEKMKWNEIMADSVKNSDWVIDLVKIEWIVMKKSTWTPTEKDFWDSAKFKNYIWKTLDSFVLIDKSKVEHKIFWLENEIDLDFWDKGIIETKFYKKN